MKISRRLNQRHIIIKYILNKKIYVYSLDRQGNFRISCDYHFPMMTVKPSSCTHMISCKRICTRRLANCRIKLSYNHIQLPSLFNRTALSKYSLSIQCRGIHSNILSPTCFEKKKLYLHKLIKIRLQESFNIYFLFPLNFSEKITYFSSIYRERQALSIIHCMYITWSRLEAV